MEKKYWSNNEFEKNGIPYTGYVYIDKGKSYDYEDGVELSFTGKSYSSQINFSNKFYDRILETDLELPYDKKNISFEANDFLNVKNVKSILKKLQENNDYIFRNSIINDSYLPASECINLLGTESHIENGKEVIDNGKLKTFQLKNKNNNKTATDPTFYSSATHKAPYDFNDIVNLDVVVSDIINDNCAKLIVFILFKTKLVIFRYDFFYINCDENLNNKSIDFNKQNTINGIQVIDRVDIRNKNSLKFLSLSDIKIYKNYMFISDSVLNLVARYDISDTLKNEPLSYKNDSVRLVDILQGDGNVDDGIYFNEPISICADDENIYVADKKNKCIKTFSNSFNYKTTFKNGMFSRYNIESISINPYEFEISKDIKLNKNSLWVFVTSKNKMFISVFDGGREVFFSEIEKIDLLNDKWNGTESFKSVKFSFTNSNYFYICTNKRIYKLMLSRPTLPYASLSYFKQRILLTTMVWRLVPYPWHILPSGEDDMSVTWNYRPPKTAAEILDNKGFSLIGHEKFEGDIIFHIGNLLDTQLLDNYMVANGTAFDNTPSDVLASSVKCSGIFLYNEKDSFISSLTSMNFPAFTSEEIEEVNHDEYVNPITFNKMLYKIIYNLVNIKNSLLGSFVGGFNIDGIMVFDELKLNDYFQQLRIENNNNLFVHDNEQISIIINRVFEEIFSLQSQIIHQMNTKFVSSPNFTNNSFKII